MTLISPDVIAELKGLSYGTGGFLLLVGFLLWGFGWRWHRFWMVFAFTAAAGVMGMSAGRVSGGHVLVMGLLLAFAGGVLAVELAKIVSFIVGGVTAWFAVQSVLPAAQELWAVFLSGGLFGVLLYRLWTMTLMSFVGVLVSWHAAFALAQTTGKYDPAKWVMDHAAALNGAVIVATLLGIVMQTLTSEQAVDVKPEASSDKKVEKKPAKKPEIAEFELDEVEEVSESKGSKETKESKQSWWGRVKNRLAA